MPSIRFQTRDEHLKSVATGRWRAGLYQEAREACEEWLQQFPGDFDAACMLAWCCLRLKEPADAAFDRAVALLQAESADGDRCMALGALAQSLGRMDTALQFFMRAAACQPRSVAPGLGAAVVLRRLGRHDEAAALCRAALALQPSAAAHVNLGAVLADQGRHDEAARHFRQAIELAPGMAEAHANLALVLRRLRSIDEAIVHLRKAVALRPGQHEFHNNLGALLADTGALDAAIGHFEHALQLHPGFADAQANLAATKASREAADPE